MSSYLVLLLAIVIWGSSVVATRIVSFMISPVLLAFLRMVIASLILAAAWPFVKEKQKPAKRDMFLIFLSALIGVSLYYILENYGVKLTAASTASLISGSYPAIALVIGAAFFHEKLTMRKAAGILISLSGIALISVNAAGGASSAAGILLLITAGINWALYNYIVQAIDPKYSPYTISAYQTWIAAVLMAPFLLLERNMAFAWNTEAALCVFYLGAVCSCLAYVLYNAGLRGVSAFAAAAMLNIMPLSGTLLSALILHEEIGFRTLAGGALIICGVMISTLNKTKNGTQEEPRT